MPSCVAWSETCSISSDWVKKKCLKLGGVPRCLKFPNPSIVTIVISESDRSVAAAAFISRSFVQLQLVSSVSSHNLNEKGAESSNTKAMMLLIR